MRSATPLRSAPEGGCSTPIPGLVGSATRQERQDPPSPRSDAVSRHSAGSSPAPRTDRIADLTTPIAGSPTGEALAGTPESSSHAPKILLQPHTPHLPVAGNAWRVPGSIPGPRAKPSSATTQWQSAPSLNLTCDDKWWCFIADHTSCSAMWKRNRLLNGLLPVQIRPRDFEGPGHQASVAGAASYPKESRWTLSSGCSVPVGHRAFPIILRTRSS